MRTIKTVAKREVVPILKTKTKFIYIDWSENYESHQSRQKKNHNTFLYPHKKEIKQLAMVPLVTSSHS